MKTVNRIKSLNVYEHDRRWRQVWAFVSLERVAPFLRALWLPVVDGKEFQQKLRAQLSACDEKTYQEHAGIVNFRVWTWFASNYGSSEQRAMALWGNRLFLLGGEDRVDESIWDAVTSSGSHREDIQAWAQQLFREIKQEAALGCEPHARRLETMNEVSAWDQRVFERERLDSDQVATQLMLMIGCNVFLSAWEHHCAKLTPERLTTIYEIGMETAEGLHMGDRGIVFPGNWRFELQTFLSKL